MSDHVVIPASHRGFGNNFYDPIVTLSYLSSLTTTIKLGTSVLIIPYRNVYVLSGMISTIDYISNGRLILGIGTGWLKDEFDVLGSNYKNRCNLTEKNIKLMAELWNSENPAKDSDHPEVTSQPGLTRKPHPPVWIGGNSRNAMERAIKFGNGWHMVGLTPVELSELIPELNEKLHSLKFNDRAKGDFVISLRRIVSNDKETLRGTVGKITDGLNMYKDCGVDYIVLQFLGGSIEEIILNINIFSEIIMGQLD